jgi:hypothetical protein
MNTTHTYIARAYFCAIFAFATPSIFSRPADPPVHGTDDLSKPDLKWSRTNDDGSEADEKMLTPSPGAAFKLTRQNPDGTSALVSIPGLSTSHFVGHATRNLKLPYAIRKKPTFINFLVHATPAPDPDSGTILNVDGAIIGFKAFNADNGSRILARIVVRNVDPDGKPYWQDSHAVLLFADKEGRALPVRLGVCLDSTNNSWSLYQTDFVIADNLPLFTSSGAPLLSVRPGLLDNDSVSIADLTTGGHPYYRLRQYLPADTHGKLDIQTALRESDPRLHP